MYFDVFTFLRVAEQYDHAYATCYQGDTQDLTLKLFCIDPSRQLAEALALAPLTSVTDVIGTVADDNLDACINAITAAARTGKIGDGKIFVTDLTQVIRIRTGETGPEAV